MIQSPTLSALHYLIACHSFWRLHVCLSKSTVGSTLNSISTTMAKFKNSLKRDQRGSEIQSTARGSMAPNPISCFCALHSSSQMYPDIVCDLSMPLYVAQKETQGTKHIMIHSSSNSRYLVKIMLTTTTAHTEVHSIWVLPVN